MKRNDGKGPRNEIRYPSQGFDTVRGHVGGPGLAYVMHRSGYSYPAYLVTYRHIAAPPPEAPEQFQPPLAPVPAPLPPSPPQSVDGRVDVRQAFADPAAPHLDVRGDP